jgi:hypothetical protein
VSLRFSYFSSQKCHSGTAELMAMKATVQSFRCFSRLFSFPPAEGDNLADVD